MKWDDATLISLVQTGVDRLSNPIYEEKEIMNVKARFQPWNQEDINIEGREVTMNQRKVILRMKKSDFPQCEKIKFNEIHDITKVKDLSRFVALYVKKYGK